MSKKALGRGLSALFTQPHSLENELIDLSIDLLEPTETQPRHVFRESKLEELAQSIRTNGVIQPIVVRRKDNRFQIIAGERRWRAAQQAGLHKVPCIVKDIPEENILELSLIENIQREELNPIEEAGAYKRLLEQLDTTQEEIARRVGKDRSSIANSLRLLRLPSEIQQMVQDGKLSMGHARALLSLDSIERQKAMAAEIIDKSLSVREAERLVKTVQNNQKQFTEERKPVKETEGERANVQAAELKLSKKLAAPVSIKFSQEGGAITIKFSSADDLTRLFDVLISK